MGSNHIITKIAQFLLLPSIGQGAALLDISTGLKDASYTSFLFPCIFVRKKLLV
jgi:hypothetical protein